MSLKSALFELKDALVDREIGQSEEAFIHDLENKNNLSSGTLVFYYNNLMIVSMKSKENGSQNDQGSKKVNRKWTKNEIELLFHYIRDRQDEGALNITEILEEVSHLLNRGYQSVNYKYYTLLKSQDKKQESSQKTYQFTTIKQTDVPVVAVENMKERAPASTVVHSKTPQDSDLLDILSGLITNVQQLPDLNLNEMLRGLYQLTNMALQNQEAVQQVETMKSTINHEKAVLQEKLRQEKKRNDELQMEVSKLAKEITAFNKLGDAAKIQNLKSYNQRLNYIIDGFGIVLQVGS